VGSKHRLHHLGILGHLQRAWQPPQRLPILGGQIVLAVTKTIQPAFTTAIDAMKMLIAALLVAVSLCAHAKGGGKGGSHSVKGHVTKKGTYVQPHRKTNPDNSKANNWSHKGNTNPYTGKEGAKE
jgi:hypothetical protein